MKLFSDCHAELSIQNFSVVCWDNIDNIWRVNFIYYVEYIFKQTEVILMIKIPFLWKELPASGNFGKTHTKKDIPYLKLYLSSTFKFYAFFVFLI